MTAWLWLSLAMGIAYATALAFRSILRWNARPLAIAWIVATAIVAATPCVVPLEAPGRRLGAALFATALAVKLYDLRRNAALARRLSAAAYAVYLVNGFQLVFDRVPTSIPVEADAKRACLSLPAGMFLLVVFAQLFAIDWSSVPSAIEHAAKVATLVVGICLTTNGLAALWRLCGGTALDPMRSPCWAATPAEFWRRWNRPAQEFLYVYVHRPVARRGGQASGILAAFAVSAIVHEYLFSIAAGRLQGWQLLFFSVQGLAVAATYRLRPSASIVPLCVAATVVFQLATGVWFFASVAELLPFYFPRD